MEPVFNPFEVLSLFAEVVVGQLGFQVVAVAVGFLLRNPLTT